MTTRRTVLQVYSDDASALARDVEVYMTVFIYEPGPKLPNVLFALDIHGQRFGQEELQDSFGRLFALGVLEQRKDFFRPTAESNAKLGRLPVPIKRKREILSSYLHQKALTTKTLWTPYRELSERVWIKAMCEYHMDAFLFYLSGKREDRIRKILQTEMNG